MLSVVATRTWGTWKKKLRMRTVTQFLTSSLCQLPSPCPNNNILVLPKIMQDCFWVCVRNHPLEVLFYQISPKTDARRTKKCEQANILLCCTSNQHLQRCPKILEIWVDFTFVQPLESWSATLVCLPPTIKDRQQDSPWKDSAKSQWALW